MTRYLLLIFWLGLTGCSYTQPLPENTTAPVKNGKFDNPHIVDPEKTVFGFLKVKYFGDVPFADQSEQTDRIRLAETFVDLRQKSDRPRVTWLGHSSFLISIGDLHILTDPILTDRASPVSFAGPKRLAPLPYSFEDLPQIDHVVISHNHYDHLDQPTIEALGQGPVYHVPLGLKAWFDDIGLQKARVEEYDWWQTRQLAGLTLTATPTQHWSARSLFDRRETLWAGWHLAVGNFSVWFAGDTGYNSYDFVETGRRFGPVDLALIPIGAYSPRDFMKPYHVNPAEAVKIHQEVQAQFSIGMHWSTFQLSAEPLDEPAQLLDQAMASQPDVAPFVTLAIGESRYFPSNAPPSNSADD
ncbi:MBL fold metallo-hydrolase [Bowmanella dokdonensis]|uniref:MBL fold metallo-hydrolase n=1 Tax=Bowmanella dokdonensis TaxID=751969 RepID=A0A939DSE0_9ALTE|nr:MBL fold metallo-hydrolase [Bowmanella dokdonensis]MBN7827350.1 MBL fold metallo-hydrolase [Bowmanella dokdonensis]